MGILDRIHQEHDESLIATESNRIAGERIRQAQAVDLEAIIRNTLEKFAKSLEEDLETVRTGSIYRIGDLVFLVELFQRHNSSLPDPSRPRLALIEYAVWLVGVDKRSSQLDRIRVGTLKFLTYRTLYDTVLKAPTYLELSAQAVIQLADQLDRFG